MFRVYLKSSNLVYLGFDGSDLAALDPGRSIGWIPIQIHYRDHDLLHPATEPVCQTRGSWHPNLATSSASPPNLPWIRIRIVGWSDLDPHPRKLDLVNPAQRAGLTRSVAHYMSRLSY